MELRIAKAWWIALCLGLAALACGDDSGGGGGTGAAGTGTAAAPATGGTGAATGGTGAGMTAAGTSAPLPLTDPMVMTCVSDALGRGETQACSECVCTNCLTEAQNVYMNPDATKAMTAQGVVTCCQNACSRGTPCYCGETNGMVDLAACAMTPMGPCVMEIEAAAGAMGLIGVAGPAADPTTALGIANAFGNCVLGNPMPTMGAAIVGKCEAECSRTCM